MEWPSHSGVVLPYPTSLVPWKAVVHGVTRSPRIAEHLTASVKTRLMEEMAPPEERVQCREAVKLTVADTSSGNSMFSTCELTSATDSNDFQSIAYLGAAGSFPLCGKTVPVPELLAGPWFLSGSHVPRGTQPALLAALPPCSMGFRETLDWGPRRRGDR